MKKYRKGIFFVVYNKEPSLEKNPREEKGRKKIKYLILRRKLHWKGWEFPKAGLEKNERKIQGVIRETKEETGFTEKEIVKINKFNVSGKYKYEKALSDRRGLAGQKYSLFAVEVRGKKVKLDKKEHSGYKWVNYNEAMKKITFENQRKCLSIVNLFLNSRRK